MGSFQIIQQGWTGVLAGSTLIFIALFMLIWAKYMRLKNKHDDL